MASHVTRSLAAAFTFALGIFLAAAPPAQATTVATISGCYDCEYFDTPSLIFHNTSGGTLTNAEMVLNGYQADNLGYSATVFLGSLAAGDTAETWGFLPGGGSCCGTTPHDLTSYDYDDEFQGTSLIIPTSDCSYPGDTNPAGCVDGGGPTWFAQTGNFSVTFTATISGGAYDGQAVFSVFSPTTNFTGGFVGWEGLDPNGYSEQTGYDDHDGTVTGTLATIDLGTPPPTGMPAPGALALLGFGLVGLGRLRRKVKSD